MDGEVCEFRSKDSSQRALSKLCETMKMPVDAHSVSRGCLNGARVKPSVYETTSRYPLDWNQSDQRIRRRL
jgi:hypothetical protein